MWCKTGHPQHTYIARASFSKIIHCIYSWLLCHLWIDQLPPRPSCSFSQYMSFLSPFFLWNMALKLFLYGPPPFRIRFDSSPNANPLYLIFLSLYNHLHYSQTYIPKKIQQQIYEGTEIWLSDLEHHPLAHRVWVPFLTHKPPIVWVPGNLMPSSDLHGNLHMCVCMCMCVNSCTWIPKFFLKHWKWFDIILKSVLAEKHSFAFYQTFYLYIYSKKEMLLQYLFSLAKIFSL